MSFINDVPIGTLVMFGGNKLPSGYLWCDGTVYNQTQYPFLYREITHNFDDGNSNFFAVPDMRGRIAIGSNYGRKYPTKKRNIVDIFNGDNLDFIPFGGYKGEFNHTLTANEVGDHLHYFQDWSYAEVQGNISNNALGLSMSRSYGSAHGYDTDNFPFYSPKTINKTLLVNTTYSPSNENKTLQPLGLTHNNTQPYCAIKYIIRAY